jgi:hypothetical protein
MFSETLFKFSLRRDPDWIDVLVRELHLRIASKLRENPDLLEIPLHNLRVWKRTADHETKLLLRRWKLILISWQFEDILDFIVADTSESRSMRRYSPSADSQSAGDCVGVGAQRAEPLETRRRTERLDPSCRFSV